MKWPWSKKPVQETAEITITIPKATVQEVKWKAVVGDWKEFSVCHCGHSRENRLEDVCPKCGCCGEWVEIVAREEWEEEDWDLRPAICWAFGRPERRNYRLVIWTQDQCEVKP